jgi:hypothetical protein|uniref:Uncharacterized protein n=1 Tax=viral metagenome TaxID=1070528 RepID=A0A6C0IUZ1_9ZZZZ
MINGLTVGRSPDVLEIAPLVRRLKNVSVPADDQETTTASMIVTLLHEKMDSDERSLVTQYTLPCRYIDRLSISFESEQQVSFFYVSYLKEEYRKVHTTMKNTM